MVCKVRAAAQHLFFGRVEKLLCRGVDANAEYNEKIPLHVLAAIPGKSSIKILELIIAYKADAFLEDENYDNAVFIAAANNTSEFLMKLIKITGFELSLRNYGGWRIFNYISINAKYGKEIILQVIENISALCEIGSIVYEETTLFGRYRYATCSNLAIL